MEIQLIMGPNGSGKSKYAEDVAVASGSKRIYLATMVSQNEENEARIEKHRLQRQGKGFETIEAAWDIDKISVDENTVVLLEDASNLVANGIFMYGADAEQALKQLLELADKCKKLIVVSISGLSGEGYDAETADYINQLNWLNGQLENAADLVVEKKHYSYFRNAECEYFPCHEGADSENHNCLFCYCPLYLLGKNCGGQFKYTRSGRKDCSDCTFPHKRENYELVTKKLEEILGDFQ